MKLEKKVIANYDNKDIVRYNIKFENNFEVEMLNLGAIFTKIITPDKDNNFENIIVGYKNIDSYFTNPSYMGATIGRTSGRIYNGDIVINDISYKLNLNYNPHNGHGGSIGFDKKIWDVDIEQKNSSIILKMSIVSKDSEENFPGNTNIKVEFEIFEDFKIVITYRATTDKTTLLNMTNHNYFNLSGNIKRPITTHDLKIKSKYILELDDTCAVTGKKLEVSNTAFDFNKLTNIGLRIDDNNSQIEIGSGYDHTYLFSENSNQIYMIDSISKRELIIDTNQNCVVVYSMNFTDDEILYNHKTNQRRYGICFETQKPPIGKNMCFLNESILNPDQGYYHKTSYKFSLRK